MTEGKRKSFLSWLDGISISTLVIVSLLLGLAPVFPEPHLWQKLKMLVVGELVRPLDIFDFLMHGTPVLLLLIRLARIGISGKDKVQE